MTINEYITRRYGSNRNRHWWGIAHRAWLLNSGRYVRTSSPSLKAQRAIRQMNRSFREGFMHAIGEAGPELINLLPHHKGTAIGMGDDHWPGCGCD